MNYKLAMCVGFYLILSIPVLGVGLNIHQNPDMSAVIEAPELELKVGDQIMVYFNSAQEINPLNEHISGTFLPVAKEIAMGFVTEVISKSKYSVQFDSRLPPQTSKLTVKKSSHIPNSPDF